MTTPSSDAHLRDLERRWKQTGSPDDEAAYLLERVRTGDLTQERLELAAHCGHEGARRALPGTPVDAEWATSVANLGIWAVVEVLISFATLGLARVDQSTVDPRLLTGLSAMSDGLKRNEPMPAAVWSAVLDAALDMERDEHSCTWIAAIIHDGGTVYGMNLSAAAHALSQALRRAGEQNVAPEDLMHAARQDALTPARTAPCSGRFPL